MKGTAAPAPELENDVDKMSTLFFTKKNTAPAISQENHQIKEVNRMKDRNGIKIIGVDHGYGNIKTAGFCFPTGIKSSEKEPLFTADMPLRVMSIWQRCR